MGTLEHLGKLEDYGVREEANDLSDLFGDGSQEKEISNPASSLTENEIREMIDLLDGDRKKGRKELTPESTLEIWNGLSNLEQKLATTSDEQFDAVIDKYGQSHGKRKQNIIVGLRKLIKSGSELASLIET